MRRPSREFRPESFKLEGRLLLTLAPAAVPASSPPAQFESPTGSGVPEPALPPRVISTIPTTQGLVVRFNKPMNPIAASNVRNYVVSLAKLEDHGQSLLGGLLETTQLAVSVSRLRLQSAHYDPATQSVTLIPRLRHLEFGTLSTLDRGHSARTPARPGRGSRVARGLTDLEGNPINGDTTPGKVELLLKTRSVMNFRGGGKGKITFLPGLH